MTGFLVSPQALDAAVAAGKVQLTRANARNVRCVNAGCRKLVPTGAGRRLWLDGHKRGYLGPCCWRGLSLSLVRLP